MKLFLRTSSPYTRHITRIRHFWLTMQYWPIFFLTLYYSVCWTNRTSSKKLVPHTISSDVIGVGICIKSIHDVTKSRLLIFWYKEKSLKMTSKLIFMCIFTNHHLCTCYVVFPIKCRNIEFSNSERMSANGSQGLFASYMY